MIIVLFMILAVLVGASFHYLDKLDNDYCYKCNHPDRSDPRSGRKAIKAKKSFYITSICYAAVMLALYCNILGQSYHRYVDDRTFLDATMEQYEGAIKLYEKYGVINLAKAAKMALTDHKYEGYQENMAGFVSSLRNKVTKYNKSIVSKRIMGDNPFFSWFIIQPDDDMKVLKICKD